MQSPIEYLSQNPKASAGWLIALWVVVVLLVLYVAGYSYKNFMPAEGMITGPQRGEFIAVARDSVLSQAPSSTSAFTGGYKTQGYNFEDPVSLNDHTYEDGLGATSGMRYFTANPEWADFESKIYATLDSVQVRTRYHNTTAGEKLAILKMRAAQLKVPLPVSAPPTVAEGMTSRMTGRPGEEVLAANLGN
jgi:hypothetical protein